MLGGGDHPCAGANNTVHFDEVQLLAILAACRVIEAPLHIHLGDIKLNELSLVVFGQCSPTDLNWESVGEALSAKVQGCTNPRLTFELVVFNRGFP